MNPIVFDTNRLAKTKLLGDPKKSDLTQSVIEK